MLQVCDGKRWEAAGCRYRTCLGVWIANHLQRGKLGSMYSKCLLYFSFLCEAACRCEMADFYPSFKRVS